MQPGSEQRVPHKLHRTRRHFRLRRPLGVEILGRGYDSDNWSVGGLRVSNFATRTRLGEILTISVSIPDADSEIVFRQKTRVVRLDEARREVALEFVGLGNQRRTSLQKLSECLTTGKIVRIRANKRSRREPTKSDLAITASKTSRKIPLKKSGLRTFTESATYSLAGLTLCSLIGSALYHNLFRVRVDSAVGYISRETLKSPSSGLIRSIVAAPGKHVVKGDTILRLENFNLTDKLIAARNHLSNMIGESIDHEILLNLQETKLRQGPERFDHTQTGKHANSKQQSLAAKLPTWDLKRLSKKQRSVRQQLTAETQKLRDLLQKLKELTLRAPFAGRIIRIVKPEGSRVKPDEPLVVMEGHSQQMLEAFLTPSEINHVDLGQNGTVNFPENGFRRPAKVIRIEKVRSLGNRQDARRQGWGKTEDKSFRLILKLNNNDNRDYFSFLPSDGNVSVCLQKNSAKEFIRGILSWI